MTDHAARTSQSDNARPASRGLTDRKLSDLARAGDQAAAWELTTRAKAAIEKAVRKATRNQPDNGRVSDEDLIQAAKLAVFKGMTNWVAGDGATYHLHSYAARIARNEVAYQLAANSPLCVDRNTRRIALELKDKRWRFAEEHGRGPEPHELARLAGTSAWEASKQLALVRGGVPLDDLYGADGEGVTDLPELHTNPDESPSAVCEKKDLTESMERVLSALPELQRQLMIHLYGLFGEPRLTTEQTCRTLGITQHRFKKLHDQAILTLRDRLRDRP